MKINWIKRNYFKYAGLDMEPFEGGINFIFEMELNEDDLVKSCYCPILTLLDYEQLFALTFN